MDPLDICVLSQQRIDKAEIVTPARVVGGIQLLDDGEADDKIVALLESDPVFDYAKDLKNLPVTVVNRIVHYFGTYKLDISGEKPNSIEVVGTYGREHALQVIEASMEDSNQHFPSDDRRQEQE